MQLYRPLCLALLGMLFSHLLLFNECVSNITLNIFYITCKCHKNILNFRFLFLFSLTFLSTQYTALTFSSKVFVMGTYVHALSGSILFTPVYCLEIQTYYRLSINIKMYNSYLINIV